MEFMKMPHVSAIETTKNMSAYQINWLNTIRRNFNYYCEYSQSVNIDMNQLSGAITKFKK